MSYQRHAEMKPANAPWVEEIPAHWDERPFYAVAKERRAKNIGMKEDNLLSLSYGNIIRKDINTPNGLLPESFETYQIVEPDDVVFRLTDLQNDKRSLRSAICPERGIITSAYLAVRSEGVLPGFMNYLMRAYDVQKVFYSMGGGMRQSLGFEDLRRLSVVAPHRDEQAAIVAFLDRETGLIDGLIEKKTRFIALLKEKRAAVITHAVTKGIDPDAPMKASGVDWLGEIPCRWSITRVGHVFRQRSVKVSDRDFPALSVTKMGILPQLEHVAKTDDNDNRKLVKAGDFVINSRSDRKGSSGIADVDGSVSLINIVLEITGSLNPRYCHHLLRSTAFQEEFYRMGNGLVADLWSTNFNAMKGISLPLPEMEEQIVIADCIDHETTRIDSLITLTERSIDLLREKRAALITAAVTGKIDLRAAA